MLTYECILCAYVIIFPCWCDFTAALVLGCVADLCVAYEASITPGGLGSLALVGYSPRGRKLLSQTYIVPAW